MKWKLVPVDPTLEMVKSGEFAGDVEIYIGDDAAEYTYKAMLAAAPQPPKLSDERILELAARAEAQWNAAADQYNQWRELDSGEITILVARAIEREILGGGE